MQVSMHSSLTTEEEAAPEDSLSEGRLAPVPLKPAVGGDELMRYVNE